MQRIGRRGFLAGGFGGLVLAAMSRSVSAETLETVVAPAPEGGVALKRYAAAGTAKRPGVVLLHGSAGFELRLRAYQRYANALTAEGIDAYLAHYYSPADDAALKAIGSRKGREAYRTGRFDAWSERVSSVLAAILARPECSGRLGLLGFSLGGYVAAETAARDERVSALAVMYGGMPGKMVPQVKRLPPMIALHGDADHNVALAEGQGLVNLAKAVGASAELVVYPGEAHGFDFSDIDPMTVDAIKRVAGFFEARLRTLSSG